MHRIRMGKTSDAKWNETSFRHSYSFNLSAEKQCGLLFCVQLFFFTLPNWRRCLPGFCSLLRFLLAAREMCDREKDILQRMQEKKPVRKYTESEEWKKRPRTNERTTAERHLLKIQIIIITIIIIIGANARRKNNCKKGADKIAIFVSRCTFFVHVFGMIIPILQLAWHVLFIARGWDSSFSFLCLLFFSFFVCCQRSGAFFSLYIYYYYCVEGAANLVCTMWIECVL